jgi:hypothetical protein
MAKPMDKRIAHQLYEVLSLNLRNVRCLPQEPKGSVQFLGFADFHLFVQDHPLINLVGNSIKEIDGKIHFDPNTEPGRGEKADQLFNTWSPTSAEARAVLTALLETCPEVQQMREEASKLRPTTKGAARANPF